MSSQCFSARGTLSRLERLLSVVNSRLELGGFLDLRARAMDGRDVRSGFGRYPCVLLSVFNRGALQPCHIGPREYPCLNAFLYQRLKLGRGKFLLFLQRGRMHSGTHILCELLCGNPSGRHVPLSESITVYWDQFSHHRTKPQRHKGSKKSTGNPLALIDRSPVIVA